MLRHIIEDISPELQVLDFHDPKVALQWCQDNRPDLLLLDYRMPAIDGLEQGLENAAEDDASREGLALTHRLLFKALESHGLEVLDPIGERFDPQWHEAMSIQPSDDQAPDTVLAVFQKGYRLNNRLLRAARVIVVASN